jgi:hypothetical protein
MAVDLKTLCWCTVTCWGWIRELESVILSSPAMSPLNCSSSTAANNEIVSIELIHYFHDLAIFFDVSDHHVQARGPLRPSVQHQGSVIKGRQKQSVQPVWQICISHFNALPLADF